MRQSHIYLAIKECNEEYGDPVEASCKLLGVSRAAYYHWLSGKKCTRELENEKIAEIMEQIHTENPDKSNFPKKVGFSPLCTFNKAKTNPTAN